MMKPMAGGAERLHRRQAIGSHRVRKRALAGTGDRFEQAARTSLANMFAGPVRTPDGDPVAVANGKYQPIAMRRRDVHQRHQMLCIDRPCQNIGWRPRIRTKDRDSNDDRTTRRIVQCQQVGNGGPARSGGQQRALPRCLGPPIRSGTAPSGMVRLARMLLRRFENRRSSRPKPSRSSRSRALDPAKIDSLLSDRAKTRSSD